MIDDIVELPRPLSKLNNGKLLVSSYAPFEKPVSQFGIMYGHVLDDDRSPVCLGNSSCIQVGKDAFYRYKMIEHDATTIREYVAIADGPFTSKDTKFFVLWMAVIDKVSLKTERFYFWDAIAYARRYFGMQDCYLLSRNLEKELQCESKLLPYPGLERSYQWAHKYSFPLKNEDTEIEGMYMLKSNLESLEVAKMCESMFNPLDVYRGVVTGEDDKPESSTTLEHLLSRNKIEQPLVKKLIGPDYGFHRFCLKPTCGITKDMFVDHISAIDEPWFEILKYIELIPYSELFAVMKGDLIDVMRVYDPYDPGRYQDIHPASIDERITDLFDSIMSAARSVECGIRELSIYRSWGEEVYITMKTKDRRVLKYYFDMVWAAFGSHMFETVNDEIVIPDFVQARSNANDRRIVYPYR